jgi:CheY-like chemotaxis protein
VLPRSDRRTVRILLVEDDALNQKLGTTVLNRLGHQVELAVHGLDAVDKMRRFEGGEIELDLVFMDIQLPKLDGMAATAQIRLLGPRAKSIPIIGLSANAYASDVAACLDAGMDDHLAKPFSTASLARAIARWTQRQSQQPEGTVGREIVSGLRPMFLEQCSLAMRSVVELKEALDDGPLTHLAKLASEVTVASHKLAGTAASFGRNELGRAALEAERFLTSFTERSDRTEASACVIALCTELAATLGEESSKAA